MSEIEDGGPAFPQPACPDCGTQHEPEHVPGMSLRDYFARGAMDSAIRHELDLRADQIAPKEFRFDAVATTCYAMADAMLRARKAK